MIRLIAARELIVRLRREYISSVLRVCRSIADEIISSCRRRSLIGEILALQLAFAIIVGLLAFGGLW